MKSKRQERTVIGSSPTRSRQSNGAVEKLSETVAERGAHNVGSTARPQAIQTDEMDGATRSLAHSSVLSSNVWSVSWKGAFGSVFAHLREVRKGSGTLAPKLADRWKSAVWQGKSDLTDERRVRTDEGVVFARSIRRIAEHRWSEEVLRSVVETLQKTKSATLGLLPAADPLAPPSCGTTSA